MPLRYSYIHINALWMRSCKVQITVAVESHMIFKVPLCILTFLKLPIVSGKDVNKFPEIDKRSSLTNWPTRKTIHYKLLHRKKKNPHNISE